MKQSLFPRTLLAAAVLFFSIASCYGQDVPADQLVGIWTKSMGERIIKFTLKADHTYEVDFAGDEGIDVTGKFEISGTRITFNDDEGEYSQNAPPGVYEYKLSETSLTMTGADDPLMGRKMLIEGNWARADE